MKKICAVLLTGIITLSLSGCGNSENTDTFPVSSAGQTTNTDSGNVLVAYFTHEGNTVFDGNLSDADAITSASVQRKGDNFPPQVIDGEHKGNTQIVAEYIAGYTGGDMFAIQVTDKDKYPIDGYETLDLAQKQRNKNERLELANHINIDKYDTIYLGFPNWWGTMPMPVFTFLEEYDFSGKTIIPFATHDGSGIGSGKRDIEKECPDAKVSDGLAIRYSDVLRSQKTVEKWIDDLK